MTASLQSVEMLRSVIDGETYEAVASRHGVTRTAVERRVKTVAVQLTQHVGIDGLHREAAGYVQRLRQHRVPILAALDEFEPAMPSATRPCRIVSAEELSRAAQRIGMRSSTPRRDQALLLVLFCTGARPLEIARLVVGDYLGADGGVRAISELRAEATISGKARPLYFTSERVEAALGGYLAERVSRCQGVGDGNAYRGLDPHSKLFLASDGDGFRITPYGEAGQRRHLCRPILEAYRKLFRYAELHDVSPLSARLTLASRLYARGADEDQVGLVLGIGSRSAVRELLPKPQLTMSDLMNDVV